MHCEPISAMDADKRRQLGYRLIDRIDEYFSSLKDRPAQRSAHGRRSGTTSTRWRPGCNGPPRRCWNGSFGAAHSF
ncbi:MAG: hypothetical protein ACYCPO_12300 [Acidobacteriaceae bacterium]